MRDIIANMVTVDLSTDTLDGSTPNQSTWVDMLGFDGAAIELLTGAVTDAGDGDGFTATLQHSDTTAAADAVTVPVLETTNGVNSLQVTSNASDNIVVGVLGYNGNKRYLRLNYVGTTGTNAIVRTVARLGKPHVAPTTYVGAAVAAT
jgi:hypothetical protein